MDRSGPDYPEYKVIAMNVLKRPDASKYASRLVYSGKRKLGHDQVKKRVIAVTKAMAAKLDAQFVPAADKTHDQKRTLAPATDPAG